MTQHIISNVSAQTRITNLLVSKLNSAFSIFSDAPKADVIRKSRNYQTVRVYNERSHMLTFSEIDIAREVIDKFCKKYKGMFYTMQTFPYLSSDNTTWLHMPVIEIEVRRYDFNDKTLKFE